MAPLLGSDKEMLKTFGDDIESTFVVEGRRMSMNDCF